MLITISHNSEHSRILGFSSCSNTPIKTILMTLTLLLYRKVMFHED